MEKQKLTGWPEIMQYLKGKARNTTQLSMVCSPATSSLEFTAFLPTLRLKKHLEPTFSAGFTQKYTIWDKDYNFSTENEINKMLSSALLLYTIISNHTMDVHKI